MNKDILKYIIDNYHTERQGADNALHELNLESRLLRKTLKDLGVLKKVDNFTTTKHNILHIIDAHNSAMSLSDDANTSVIIEKYLENRKKQILLKKIYPYSESLVEWFNLLDDFEKRYISYILKTADNLLTFLEDSKNVKKDLEKLRDYDDLKTDMIKSVLKIKRF